MSVTTSSLLILIPLLWCSTDPARLTASPSRSQFFEGSSVTLSCEEEDRSDGWSVRRNTSKRQSGCGEGWGKPEASSCYIEFVFSQDTGVYWCSGLQGAASSSINLTVTGGPVILLSPVLPVMEGDDLTLTCQSKGHAPNLPAGFYKDGVLIGNASTGHMTLHHVSRSDEGLYRCDIRGHGGSAPSWLSVTDKPSTPGPPTTVAPPSAVAPPPASASPFLLFSMIFHLVFFCFFSVPIMVFLYRHRTTGSDLHIYKEKTPPTDFKQGLDEDYDDVTTEHDL